jgi:hypothetical protein
MFNKKLFFVLISLFIMCVLNEVNAQQEFNPNPFYDLNKYNVGYQKNTPSLPSVNTPSVGPTKNNLNSIKGKFLPIIQCGQGESSTPCTFLDAIETFNRIVNWFVSIAAALGALTMAYAGAMMLLNPGNTGKLEEAKEMFKKTMIGLIWLLVAWIIVFSVADRFIDPNIKATRFLK